MEEIKNKFIEICGKDAVEDYQYYIIINHDGNAYVVSRSMFVIQYGQKTHPLYTIAGGAVGYHRLKTKNAINFTWCNGLEYSICDINSVDMNIVKSQETYYSRINNTEIHKGLSQKTEEFLADEDEYRKFVLRDFVKK